MAAPCFSIAIPTYIRAGLIGLTLNPVLAQALPERELLVVDAGLCPPRRAWRLKLPPFCCCAAY